MSSKFVSSSENSIEIKKAPNTAGKSEEAWIKVQKEIQEAAAARKAEEFQRSKQTADKSLFEILEANKAAKQEAFEEATRLRNQFRALDEDEVNFLDSVLEGTRAQEAKVKAETVQGIRLFRRRQAEEDQKIRAEVIDSLSSVADNLDTADITTATTTGGTGEKSPWAASRSRKRKRTRESKINIKLVKNLQATSIVEGENLVDSLAIASETSSKPATTPKNIFDNGGVKLPLAAAASKNALVSYRSDDEDW
ncbi:putative nefa-interacting nuclear protein [Erysiphe neolycopersici]|uniref:Putative nefa-interacting nuclear protein n=1 Tax=Erysiphe neolycopersici TaxID=212602 RepID=A0A420HU80_9PEZI|nr:putative nefa-interacting nuclear protein [Erysiphe neolycopersici]